MCNPIAAVMVIGAIAGSASAYEEQKSSNKAAEFNAKINDENKLVADQQAKFETEKGVKDERRLRMQTKGFVGEQKSALAASGVDIGTGSALDVMNDTKITGEQDAMTIRQNAQKAAWGYQQQSKQFGQQAKFQRNQKRSPDRAAFSSLLTGASNLVNRFAK